MDENLIFDVTRQALWIAVQMSAPLLVVARSRASPSGFSRR